MGYLLIQILLFLILAAVVGFFVGWVIRGFGFESRMISSENQWRAKHHVLQSENHRLLSELRHYKEQQKRAATQNSVQQTNRVLPTQEPPPAVETSERSSLQQAIDDSLSDDDQNETLNNNHPLDRLRSKLADIEDDEPDTVEQLIPGKPPAPLIKPLGEIDDLKQISGIGPKIENTLNDLGIFHFQQIADFDDENVKWVNEHLNFKGRIEREKWVEQAREIVRNI